MVVPWCRNGRTPLHTVALTGNCPVLQFLLRQETGFSSLPDCFCKVNKMPTNFIFSFRVANDYAHAQFCETVLAAL